MRGRLITSNHQLLQDRQALCRIQRPFAFKTCVHDIGNYVVTTVFPSLVELLRKVVLKFEDDVRYLDLLLRISLT